MKIIKFFVGVILACIALYLMIHVTLIFGYIGFLAWLLTQ